VARSAEDTAESAGDAATAGRGTQRRFPDFFIVGHPKSGTTALYEMLRRHPQIHMPVKEPSYFGPEVGPRWRAQDSQQGQDPLEEYLSLFEAAAVGQQIGEATPSYLRSPSAAQRIASVQPGARIIAILREPASFVRSLHLQFVQSHMETEKDLRKALMLEDARREGHEIPHGFLPQTFLYADRVRYVEQLARYHDAFPSRQVLVLIYDDFRRDNVGTVRRVLSFLDVDDAPVEMIEANPTVRLRSRRLHDAMQAVAMGSGPASTVVKLPVKALVPRGLRLKLFRTTRRRVLYGDPQPPDEQLTLELRRRFKPEILALSEYLGRDLASLWGYDALE
jgi:hypothetical protein